MSCCLYILSCSDLCSSVLHLDEKRGRI
uniref:Uncharacterized protein n=1 Tax=Arundo donax TaxID=35708 RepID=A0A0A9AEW4_ARUDO